MRRVGGRGKSRRVGAILLIRGVGAYSATRVKFELGGWEDGWMGGDGSRVEYER